MSKTYLAPVTYCRHKDKGWSRFESYHFAENLRHCPIVLQEIFQAASAYPIVFRQIGQHIMPVALLSMSETQTSPFIAPDGRWLASYVPAALRCPPFEVEVTDPKTEDYRLMVNERSELIGLKSDGEPFFDDKGELSQELRRVLVFLKACAIETNKTRKLCQMISDLGFLKPMETFENVSLPKGCFGASLPKVREMPSDTLAFLYESGALLLIHAHKVSMAHCTWISRAQEKLTYDRFAKPFTENSEVSDFIQALACAQSDEMIESGEM